jgi:putative ABC transport system permease protein
MFRLALRFALYDPAKAFGALLGVLVATFLVAQQAGTFLFLTGLMSSLSDHARADLWVVAPESVNVAALRDMDARVRWEVASVPGVARVHPVVLGPGVARLPDGGAQAVVLLGSPAPDFAAGPWALVEGSQQALMGEGAVTVDLFEQANLGGIGLGDRFEVSGHQAVVAGVTRGARGFGGIYLFTTLERAGAWSGTGPGRVSALLVEVEAGQDLRAVRDAVNSMVPGVRAWLPGELSSSTRRTVLATSGIGFSVGALIAFAVLAGFLTVGLTMYSSALDRIRDFGTMKAIGATDRALAGILVRQALLYATSGFLLGMGLAEIFRRAIARSGVLFQFSVPLMASFLGMILLVSLAGSLFAIRRVRVLEPSAVFRA